MLIPGVGLLQIVHLESKEEALEMGACIGHRKGA